MHDRIEQKGEATVWGHMAASGYDKGRSGMGRALVTQIREVAATVMQPTNSGKTIEQVRSKVFSRQKFQAFQNIPSIFEAT